MALRVQKTAEHLGTVPSSVAAPPPLEPPPPRDLAPLASAPLSPLLPWGRLLTAAEPLPELLGDERRAAAVRAELLEHGVVCFRPPPGAELLTAAEFTQVLARLNPGAQSDADALARMKTYESTPADTATDAADPETLDCPKAHIDGWPNVRLLGSERDPATGRAKQLYCETGYEWHTDNVGPAQTALYCRQPLSAGGETLFTSAARMYTLLSPPQKRELESLTAVHSNRFTAGGPSAFDCHHGLRMNALGTEVVRGSRTQRPSWALAAAGGPLLEHHSATGLPYLVVVAKNLDQIEGMSVEESRRKLTELMLPGLGGEPAQVGVLDWEHSDGLTVGKTAFDPAFVYEHVWQAGDLVVVCSLHSPAFTSHATTFEVAASPRCCLAVRSGCTLASDARDDIFDWQWDNETMLHSTTPVDAYRGGPRLVWQIVQDTGPEESAAETAAGDASSGVMTVGGSKDPRAAEKLGASHLRMTRQNRKST